MTAQVAVMNTLGIGLATDSTVTVSSGAGKTRKTYSSYDKLFQLSDVAPVAIMTSGRADFLDMPWETVIKVYREQLGEKTFPKLSGYATDFFRFVQTNTKMFPQSARNECFEYIAWDLLMDVLDESNRRHKEIDSSAEKAENSMWTIIHAVAIESMKAEKKYKKITGFGAAMDRTVRAKHGKLVAKERKEVFENHRLPAKTQRALDNLIFESIARTNFRSMETDIVFAGFGKDDYVPAYLHYAVEGVVDKKLRYHCEHKMQISPGDVGYIGAFGQRDVVDAFTDGVSVEFRSYMEEKIDNFVKEAVGAFEHVSGHEYTERESEKLSTILRKKWEELSEQWNAGERKSWLPIFRTVASLPKPELAATAEMLVNLTKLRLRVSPEQETVGGPIDVAIITKGDGFVWIKKKQYFPAELNPHKTGRPV